MNEKKKIRKVFRDTCHKRDKYSCVMCGFKSTPEQAIVALDVHHIQNRNHPEFLNGAYVPQNGISLCHICHIKAEEYHSTGIAAEGFHPDDLYKKIKSSFELAKEADKKLK